MKNKQTLFQRVYDDLHDQIVTGRLAFGTMLPSMRMLCDSYHVGIRTIKDVMGRLRAEGYIRTEERKAAVVVYDRLKTDRESAVRSVLEYKTCIIDVCDTMAYIMPPILAFCAAACGEQEMEKWKAALKNLHKKDAVAKSKLVLSFQYFLLEQPGNLLLRDLYASLELCAKVPLFQNFEGAEGRSLPGSAFDGVRWPLEALMARDRAEIERQLRTLYRAVRQGIQRQLDGLSQAFPAIPAGEANGFTFDIQYGRDAFYIQIVHDLIDKIGAGTYRIGTYLPPEAALAETYGVCIATVRRALAMLNEIGFAKTYNAKGTLVIWQEDEAIVQCMKNKKLRLETLLYLSGLQLMAILIKPAAALAFPHIDEADRRRLHSRLGNPDFILFDGVVQCVVRRQPLPPFKRILEKIGELLVGGYYYAMFYEGPSGDDVLIRLAGDAYRSLCDGDAQRFGECLSQCYCRILDYVRDYMVKCGLTEAKKIIAP